MYSGKVTRGFRDKYTGNRFEMGSVYSHKDEGRLKELHGLDFVEYKSDGDKPKQEPKGKAKSKSAEK